MIKKVVLLALFFLVLLGLGVGEVNAKEETLGSLEEILFQQELGAVWPANPLKYAIRPIVGAGVPASTIVLLLLLPFVSFFPPFFDSKRRDPKKFCDFANS